jgi:hypothetical protein
MEGEEIGSGVAAAPWFGEHWNSVELAVGETRHVIIAAMKEEGGFEALSNVKAYHDVSYAGNSSDGENIEFSHFPDTHFIAEVQLLNYPGDLLMQERFEVGTGAPSIKRV